MDVTESPTASLRHDFEIYKTQVAICAWCAVGVSVLLICALIYAYILIRKLRLDMEEKVNECQRIQRFTIDRPKLVLPYESNNGQIKMPSTPTSFEYTTASPQSPRNQQDLLAVKGNRSPRSPSPISNSNLLQRRAQDNFLNQNRAQYNGPLSPRSPQYNSPPPQGDVSPLSPSTPSYKNVNVNTPAGKFF